LLSNNFLQPAMTGFGKLSPLVASYKGQDQTFSDMLKVAAKAATAPLYLDYNRLSTQFITENQNYLKGGETLKQMQSNMAALEKSINLTTAAK